MNRRTRTLAATVLMLSMIAASCAAVGLPTAVLNVPGSYTFTQPIVNFTFDGPVYGPLGGWVPLCVDTTSALQVDSTRGVYATISSADQSVRQTFSPGSGRPWITTPIGPGCFKLSVGQGSGYINPAGTDTATVTVTKT
jgi:hypothetical protein